MSVAGQSMMAAIGSRMNETAGEVTIHGGIIEVQGNGDDNLAGSWGSAAIGSGPGGRAGSVTIYGGTVFAAGGKYSAAIGGGSNGNGGSVAVYGGRVVAKGGAGAAGIGHGVADDGNNALSDGTLALGSNMTASGGQEDFNTVLGTGPCDNVNSRGTYIGICEQVYYRDAAWDNAAGRVSYTGKKTLHYWESVANLEIDSRAVTLHDGWYLVEDDVDISDAFVRVEGTVNLILADNSSFNAKLGVQIAPGSTLNVYSQSDSRYTGVLTAQVATQFNTPNGYVGLAGIGGTISYQVLDTPGMADVTSEDPGALVVYGGRIVASGSANAAGIGGNWGKAGGAVTIYGGEVTATGGSNASGIGGGGKGDGGAVTIYGGKVTATGGSNASGIGGGDEGNGGAVTVYGGEVTTTGNDSPGIGHGNYLYSSCSDGTLSLGQGRAAYGGQDYSTLRATGPCEDVTPRDSWIRITDELNTGNVRYQEASWEKTFVKYTFKSATRWVPVSANTTTWRDGWYVVDGNTVAENTINVYGTANLILKDGSKLTANKGIRVEEGSTLNVYAQIGGTGALVARGYSEWTYNPSDGSTILSESIAAIGASGNSYGSAKAGSVVIHGGKVTAEGDYETAGIGGSVGGSGGAVTIYGGEVTATGGSLAAGIGGGCEGDGGSVEIYGGTVVATGGSPEVMGIGAGSGGSQDGTVSLKDTNLEMRGGSDYTLPLGSGPCDNIDSRDSHMRVVKTFHGDGPVSFVESSWDGTRVVKTKRETDSWDRVSLEVTSWSGGVWYVVSESDVYVNERIMVSGTVNLVLGDGVKLTAPKGINLPSGSTLNIYAQQEGTGELVIERFGESVAGAGIGGDNGESGGNLVVHGGVVRVTGNQADQYGAGIGGGYMGDGGQVVVYAGTVEATGNPCGAGIGGGCFGDGGETIVYGGTVKGTCLYEAAGIGGGKSGDGGSLTVYGGTVEATGGTYSAGIGGGHQGSGGVVTLYGGEISAVGIDYGAGVGGGYCGACGEVNVYGGSLKATGGFWGAGIGSGVMGDEDNGNSGGSITISGGEVIAEGGINAAGIGGGAFGSGVAVTVTGGSVTATGSDNAEGIGVGLDATENGVLSVGDGLYVYGDDQQTSLLGAGPCENLETRTRYMRINGTIDLALAEVEFADDLYVYTGSQLTPAVTVKFGGVEIPAEAYDVSYGENVLAGKDAGSVTVTAKEGIECAGSKTATFDIARVNNAINDLSIEGWTYGEQPNTPTATAAEGEVIFTYADAEDGPWSPDVPTSAGEHWVKAEVAATDDYEGTTATAKFTIAKASISLSVSMTDWQYGQRTSENGPVVEGNTGTGSVRCEYKAQDADDASYSTDVPFIPGAYTVRATVDETDNYLGGSATDDFKILTNGEGVPYRRASWNDETSGFVWSDALAESCIVVDENIATLQDDCWYIVEGNVVVESTVTVTGTANLILKDGSQLEARNGITVSEGSTLNVYAQSRDAAAGKLVATGTNGPGIECANGSKVTVSGGDIHAVGGANAPGIGNQANDPFVLQLADGLWAYGGEGRTSLLGAGPCADVDVNESDTFIDICATAELPLADITLANGSYVHTGSQVKPGVTVELGGVKIPTFAYDVSYGENIHAGEGAGSVTVTAKEGIAYAGFKTATFDIAKADNEIVVSIEGWTYGEQPNAPTATATAGEPTFSYADAEEGPWSSDVPTSAGEHWVKAEVAATDDYGSATDTTSFNIAKASNEIVSLSVGAWTYGDEAVAPKVEARYGTPTLSYAAYYDGDNNPRYSSEVCKSAGEYWVKAEVAPTDNYEGATATARFTIMPKKLSVGNVIVANKEYDGDTSAVITDKGTLVGVVDEKDDIQLDDTGVKAQFDNENPGEDKNVYLSGYWLTGASQHYYLLVQPTVKANIERCKVRVGGITAENKVYDGNVEATIDASGAVIVDTNGKVVGGDIRASVEDNKGEFDSKDAGMRKAVSFSVTLEGADVSYYEIDDSAQVVARANITPIEAVIEWTDTQHTYDGYEYVPVASVENRIGEDDVTVEVAGEQTDVGLYTATATKLSGYDKGNYSLPKQTVSVDYEIAKADNSISFSENELEESLRASDIQKTMSLQEPTDSIGEITYAIQSQTDSTGGEVSYFAIQDSEMTVQADTPAGTYSVVVAASAAGDTNHNPGTATYTMPLKITDATEPSFAGYRLRLSGVLGLRYYMEIPDGFNADGAKMTFTIKDETQTVTFDNAKQETIDGTEYSVFDCGVQAYLMAENITAVFSYGDGQSVTRQYNVKNYLDSVKDGSFSTNTKNLMDATRAYGHFIQPYLHDVNGTSHKTLKYDGNVDVEGAKAGVKEYAVKVKTYTEPVSRAKYYLTVADSTTLNIEITLDGEYDNVSVMLDGKAYTPSRSGNVYKVKITNIAANNLGFDHAVVMKIGDNAVFEINASAMSYVNTMINSGSSNEHETNALSALYHYYKAAKAYADNPDQ